MLKKRNLFLSLLFALTSATPLSAQTNQTEDPEVQTYTTDKIDKFGDFDFELWRDEGEALMTINKDGTFICEWDKSKTSNVLFRTGKKLGSTKTYDELGTISLEYACDYQPKGVSYLCVYGWSVDPLVEFYILENFSTYNPGTDNTIYKGNVTIDGVSYSLYEGERVDKPSIKGNTTFKQYWSIRDIKSKKGTIPISEHFKAWEEVGMTLGKMYEVSLCVEGYNSSGYANVYSNRLTIGDTVIGVVNDLETDIEPAVNDEEKAETSVTTSTAVTGETVSSTENNEIDTEPNTKNNSRGIIFIVLGIIGVIGIAAFIIIKNKIK